MQSEVTIKATLQADGSWFLKGVDLDGFRISLHPTSTNGVKTELDRLTRQHNPPLSPWPPFLRIADPRSGAELQHSHDESRKGVWYLCQDTVFLSGKFNLEEIRWVERMLNTGHTAAAGNDPASSTTSSPPQKSDLLEGISAETRTERFYRIFADQGGRYTRDERARQLIAVETQDLVDREIACEIHLMLRRLCAEHAPSTQLAGQQIT